MNVYACEGKKCDPIPSITCEAGSLDKHRICGGGLRQAPARTHSQDVILIVGSISSISQEGQIAAMAEDLHDDTGFVLGNDECAGEVSTEIDCNNPYARFHG